MTITNKITIDMAKPGVPPTVHAVQFDTNTRAVAATLTANGLPVELDGYTASVVFRKPDGTSGWYDMMPDKTSAVSIAGNTVTAMLVPQVLTVSGNVIAAIRIELDADRATTFPFVVAVEADPSAGGEKSTDYYRVTTWGDLNDKLYNQIYPNLSILAEISLECVRFKTAQELTDRQKQTARANIGAGIGDASIDNAAVGADTWSSKNIIDRLCPAFTISGPAVRCQPVEGYPLQVTTLLPASEDGYTGITLRIAGKNLYDKDNYPLSNDYVQWESGNLVSPSTSFKATGHIPVSELRGKAITLNHCPNDKSPNTRAGMAFYEYDAAEKKYFYISGTNLATMTVPENATHMRFSVPNEYSEEDIQIEVGTEVTDYEPYREGSTIAVDFGKEINGGNFDWTRGELTETVMVTPGSDGWYFNNAFMCFMKDIPEYKNPARGEQFCSLPLFPYVPGLGDNEVIEIGFCIAYGRIHVCYPELGEDNIDAFKEFINAQEAAGTPLQFWYETIPEAVGEGVQIQALSGINTICSDVGKTSVSGREDLIAHMDKLQQTVADQAEQIAALQATNAALLEG